MQKGINLAIRDLKNDLAKCINENNLPPMIVGYVLNDLLVEVNNITNNAIQKEDFEYKKSLEEKENNKKKSDKEG